MKILYAAGNNVNSRLQLERFLQAVQDKPYKIKIAAYKKSSPNNTHIDWTLDCLLNFLDASESIYNNDNFKIYMSQINNFSPNLIISDLEYFTSYLANLLNIKLWQYSSSLINFSISHEAKYGSGIFKKYAYVIGNKTSYNQKCMNMIENSDNNFIYSHLGDIDNPPSLINKSEWIRPYYLSGKISIPCQHNIVAAVIKNNKKIISLLKHYNDSILFTDLYYEKYKNILSKDINNKEEYACNLKNSQLFVCEGQTNFLADAFYNNKFSIVLPSFTDPECLTNSALSEHYKFSANIFGSGDNIHQYLNNKICSFMNPNIKYIHEKIDEILLP